MDLHLFLSSKAAQRRRTDFWKPCEGCVLSLPILSSDFLIALGFSLNSKIYVAFRCFPRICNNFGTSFRFLPVFGLGEPKIGICQSSFQTRDSNLRPSLQTGEVTDFRCLQRVPRAFALACSDRQELVNMNIFGWSGTFLAN